MNNIGIFGEVLFDRFPDGLWLMGGAPFNVAWHLQAFAASPLFISRIGADEAATPLCTAMRQWGLSTEGLQIDVEHPTGQVEVSFSNGQPVYAILDQQAYDFIDADELPEQPLDILYYGSLALRNPVSRMALTALQTRGAAKLFMDVNLRVPWWDRASLDSRMAAADWLKLNDEELAQLQPGATSQESAMRVLKQQYQLEAIVVTCGSNGALAIGPDSQLLSVGPPLAVTEVDTVGAGDAFAAVLLLGIQRGWDLQLSLQRAQQFAAAVVGQRGATVQDKGFYQEFISDWRLEIEPQFL
jgi:fructokinase